MHLMRRSLSRSNWCLWWVSVFGVLHGICLCKCSCVWEGAHTYMCKPEIIIRSLQLLLFVLKQGFTMELWLPWNSLCRPGWPWNYREPPASASRVLASTLFLEIRSLTELGAHKLDWRGSSCPTVPTPEHWDYRRALPHVDFPMGAGDLNPSRPAYSAGILLGHQPSRFDSNVLFTEKSVRSKSVYKPRGKSSQRRKGASEAPENTP